MSQRIWRAVIAGVVGLATVAAVTIFLPATLPTAAAIGLGIIVTTVIGVVIDEGIVRRYIYPAYGLGP